MSEDNTAFYISQAENFEYVTSETRAWELLKALDPDEIYALDFETTALSPMEGSVRLTTICGHGQLFIIDHFRAGGFEAYVGFMRQREWAVFYAGFEGMWFDYHADSSDEWVVLHDVQNMRKAKMGGMALKLASMCKLDLKLIMSKDEQSSNWAAEKLTYDQMLYAALDGVATFALLDKWLNELTAEQWNGYLVINEAWRGTNEMQDTALVLDDIYHEKLLKWWELKCKTAENYLRRWASVNLIPNLNSKQQIGRFIKDHMIDDHAYAAWPKTGKTQQMDLTRSTLTQAAYRLPYPYNRWLAALIIYNKMTKYIGTYGQKMIDSQRKLGKVPSRFNIAQAVTGRYSSSSFNLQNIPRNPVVRRSFIARLPHKGETDPMQLVMADYSSIEVRVLAELANDERLREDAIYGDVHSRSASQIFGIDFDYFSEVIGSKGEGKYANVFPDFKDKRSRAKAFTFQLLYGAGGPALAVVLKCSDEDAFRAIDAWAEVYRRAYDYRTLMFEKMNHSGFLPVIDGRTIFVYRQDRTMPVAANYPVQGAAASVMYRAVKRTHKLVYDSGIACRLAATVHDELLMYSRKSCAEQAGVHLIDGMVAGWLDIFPGTDTANLIGKGNKPTIGWHWGQKE